MTVDSSVTRMSSQRNVDSHRADLFSSLVRFWRCVMETVESGLNLRPELTRQSEFNYRTRRCATTTKLERENLENSFRAGWHEINYGDGATILSFFSTCRQSFQGTRGHFFLFSFSKKSWEVWSYLKFQSSLWNFPNYPNERALSRKPNWRFFELSPPSYLIWNSQRDVVCVARFLPSVIVRSALIIYKFTFCPQPETSCALIRREN